MLVAFIMMTNKNNDNKVMDWFSYFGALLLLTYLDPWCLVARVKEQQDRHNFSAIFSKFNLGQQSEWFFWQDDLIIIHASWCVTSQWLTSDEHVMNIWEYECFVTHMWLCYECRVGISIIYKGYTKICKTFNRYDDERHGCD